jgi:hypothetical protein
MSDEPETTASAAPAEQPAQAEKPAKAPKAPKAPKAEKAKKPAKAKGAKAGKGGELLPSIANHPRAGARVRRAKGWGGLGGFVLVGVLSWRAHVPGSDVLLRAIMGGVAGYVATWAAAVALWRHLVIAELRAVRVARLTALAEKRRPPAG